MTAKILPFAGLCHLGLAAALLVPVPALGSDTAAGRLEEVQVTASRTDRSTADVAAGVSVIVADDPVAAPLVATDLLRGTPGAFVQQTTPGQGIPIVRGLKGSEVLHLVDGMRLNNAFFRNAPNQYLALVDARSLRRVEVLRGPSSSLYGADAMGGVVQMISALPEFSGTDTWQRSALLDYSTAASATTAHLGVDYGTDRVAATAAVTLQDVGERRAGGGVELPYSGYTSEAARAAVRLAPTDTNEWLFDVQYLRQPETPRHDELVPGFGQTEPASAVFLFEPNDRLFLHARHRREEVSEAIDRVEFHVAYQSMNDDRRTRDTGSSEERREHNRSDLLGLTAQANSGLGEAHQLTFGAEAYFDRVSSERVATDIDTGVQRTVNSRFPDGSTMNSFALYLHDEVELSSAMSVNMGARLSRFEVELAAADRGVGADITLNDVTANAGLVYRLDAGINLVANIGRGFRPPNIFDLGTLGTRPGNRFNIANPSLGPESVLTGDFGVKIPGRQFYVEALLWYSEYTDKIDSVATGDLDPSGRMIVQARNLGQVDLWGAEAGFRWQIDQIGLELNGTLNYSRGEEHRPGEGVEPADRMPPFNGRLGMRWRPGERWWVNGEVRFADAQRRLSARDVRDPRINPAGTAGWGIVDFGAGWDVSQSLTVGARVRNLGDRRYREHGSGIDAPGRDFGVFLKGRF